MPHTSTSSVDRSRAGARTGVIADAVATVSVPKAAPADSFILHAPLELMARVRLLPFVDATKRDAAVEMIEWLADRYNAAGDPVEPSPAVAGEVRPAALIAALADGDQALVDALAVAVLPTLGAAAAAGLLGEAVVPSLAAAGHAPIGLALLLRGTRGPTTLSTTLPTTLLRGPLRALAARPDWQLTWHESPPTRGDALPNDTVSNSALLYAALRAAPRLGRPGSDFIHPLMSQAQQPGVADRLLGPVLADRYDVPSALHTLTRIAAWSMLHDDPAQAPYGWTHAMTMPQAVMSLAGAGVRSRTALAVASTFALGFRVAHGTVELPERIVSIDPSVSAADVAGAAALHEDAHLVKFTLACLHAAQDDPAFAGLYLAAAAHLVAWWSAKD